MNAINIIRITQILVEEGWLFIDNGCSAIDEVYNINTKEEICFPNEEGLMQWLDEQANRIKL